MAAVSARGRGGNRNPVPPGLQPPGPADIPIVKSGTEESLTPVGTGPYYFTTDEAGACLASHSGWWRGESRPAERIALSAARDREAILYQFSSHEVQLITADLIGTGAHHRHRQHQL